MCSCHGGLSGSQERWSCVLISLADTFLIWSPLCLLPALLLWACRVSFSTVVLMGSPGGRSPPLVVSTSLHLSVSQSFCGRLSGRSHLTPLFYLYLFKLLLLFNSVNLVYQVSCNHILVDEKGKFQPMHKRGMFGS